MRPPFLARCRRSLVSLSRSRVAAVVIAIALSPLTPNGARAQSYSALATFNGEVGGTLSESMIAVGPDTILEVTPNYVVFYQKNGTQASRTAINTFFADQLAGAAVSGDAVCYYDALRGRYLMAVMSTRNSNETLLWISKGVNFTNPDNWWKYRFSNSGRDYPGIGVSDDKLALRVDNGNTIYILDRAAAYAGQYANQPNLTPIQPISSGWIKPCRNTTSDSTLHLVAKTDDGRASYWKVTGPASNPVVTGPSTIPITPMTGLFGDIGTEQPDTSAFNSCGPRLLQGHVAAPMPETYMRNGNITMTWTVERNYHDGSPTTSAIRVVRFRASDQAVLDTFLVGRPGITYVFGSAVEDDHGTIFVGYDRYSANEWPACYMVAHRGGHESPEFLVKTSFTSYGVCNALNGVCTSTQSAAWGDYTSMVLDEFATNANSTTVRYVGEFAPNFTTPLTAIGAMVASYVNSSISGTALVGASGAPGIPIDLSQSGVSVAHANTGANGSFSFSLLPAGTYVLRMELDPSVATSATAGTGGTVLSSTEISVTVGTNATSTGNQFTLSSQPTPTITSLSTTAVPPMQADFDLVVTGQDFKPYSRVRIDGRDKVTTYNGPGSLTGRVLHYDVARTRPHTVTVYTPAAPGAGTSGASTLSTGDPLIVSQTYDANVAACPAGDGEHLAGMVVVLDRPECGIDRSTLQTRLIAIGQGVKAWGAQSIIQPYIYVIPGSVSYSPASQLDTLRFDWGALSGCGTLSGTLQFKSTAIDTNWKNLTVISVTVHSFDLDTLVHGAVDRFDTAALDAQMNTSGPCADYNFDYSVGLPDLAMQTTHLGHHYQTRHVLAPNGGESFVKSGTGYTIPIAWNPGEGDSATVTLKSHRGSSVATIATNVPDNGEYDWSACSVPNGTNWKVEVIHTAGTYQSGQTTLGSDMSDTTFSISGSCTQPGCPFVDTWTAGRWVEENSILGRTRDGSMIQDLYGLTTKPELQSDGTVRLRVRESEQERTRLTRPELVVVDRAAGDVSRALDGRIVVGERVPAFKVTSASGIDLSMLFAGPKASGYNGSPGDILMVQLFGKADGDDEDEHEGTRLIDTRFGGVWITGGNKGSMKSTGRATPAQIDRDVLDGSGIVVEKQEEDGKWVQTDRVYPREHTADLGIAAGEVFRLRFVGRHRIDGIGWFRLTEHPATPVTVSAENARHSRLGDVLASLKSRDGEVALTPGDDIELNYHVPPPIEGMERDYYLATRGVYTTDLSGSGMPALPTRLELSPPRPNPTRGSVSMIEFALPTADRVQIRVYDAQGRFVRSLIDENREAGRHQILWNIRDLNGRLVPSGIYFYRMDVGRWRQERKVTVSN